MFIGGGGGDGGVEYRWTMSGGCIIVSICIH